MHTPRSFPRDIVLFIIFLALCIGGLLGIPSWPIPTQTFGYFSFSKNPWGYALYQKKSYASLEFKGFDAPTISGDAITFGQPPSPATIAFSRDDIIFDQQGIIYTDPPDSDITTLSVITNRPFHKYGSVQESVPFPSSVLFILTPTSPGMVKLTFTQGKNTTINKNEKVITTDGAVRVEPMDRLSTI